MLDECVSMADHVTEVLPIVFAPVVDWQYTATNESEKSLIIFTHIALALCAEIGYAFRSQPVLSEPGQRRKSMVITAFLLSQLNALEAFLKQVLPPLFVRLQEYFGVCDVTTDWVTQLINTWDFRGPFSVGGADADIAVCLGVRRQRTDTSWQGLSLEKPLIYTALTRAKYRLYVCLDMALYCHQEDVYRAKVGVWG